MADSLIVVGRKSFVISTFLAELKKIHKGGSVGVGFEQLANYFNKRHSSEGRVVKATITRITDNKI